MSARRRWLSAIRYTPSPRTRLSCLALEERVVPAVYLVGNTNNAGPDSLRQATTDANANVGHDTISFDPVLFAVPQTINLTTGELKITSQVTIAGPGSTLLTVHNAAANSRIFDLFYISANISGMSITGGHSNDGGGLYAEKSDLHGTDFVVANNFTSGTGGGIFLNQSTMTLVDSVVSDNEADATDGGSRAGGIYSGDNSSLTLQDCTISGNKAGWFAGGIFAAGNYDGGSNGQISITGTTISNNQAGLAPGLNSSWAGGIHLGRGGMSIKDCTISGNSVGFGSGKGFGGGIFAGNNYTFASIQNTTIAFNSASGGGGGIRNSVSNSVGLYSTIVYGNTVPPGYSGHDVSGQAYGDHSLFGTSSGAVITGKNNIFGVNPLLNPLANNGGPTKTHTLQSGSIALDAGINPSNLPFDQRGSLFPRQQGGGVDIGSTEAPALRPTAVASVADVSTYGGIIATFSVTYTDLQTSIDATTLGDDDVIVTGPNNFAVAAHLYFNTVGSVTTAKYVFLPPGGTWDGTDLGTYTLNMYPDRVFDTDAPLHNAVLEGVIGTFKVDVPANYVVVNTNDFGVGSNGQGDLRYCIGLANAHAGLNDTITFDATVFSSAKTIALVTQLDITDAVTITGPGAGNATIDAKGKGRIFNIAIAGSTDNSVMLSGVTLTGGVANQNGGAILDQGQALTLANVVITGNTTTLDGGAVSLSGGTGSLTLLDSTLSNNVASGHGGGIAVASAQSVVVQRSTISGNRSGEDGAGIYFFNGGSLTMDASTVSGNKSNTTVAGAGGGGIYFFNTTATLRNCTVSGNTPTRRANRPTAAALRRLAARRSRCKTAPSPSTRPAPPRAAASSSPPRRRSCRRARLSATTPHRPAPMSAAPSRPIIA